MYSFTYTGHFESLDIRRRLMKIKKKLIASAVSPKISVVNFPTMVEIQTQKIGYTLLWLAHY